jgi:cell wall-associated NlpC family hydrolase
MNLMSFRAIMLATPIVVGALALEMSRPATRVLRAFSAAERHAADARAFSQRQLALRDSIVRVLQSQLGARYVLGGAAPGTGFDCSGLVQWAFSQVHVVPPRMAFQQARIGEPIPRDGLRPGDLLTFGERDSVSHIGVYIGDGRFVHASSVAGKVIVSSLDRPQWRRVQPLKGARRVIVLAEAPHLGM